MIGSELQKRRKAIGLSQSGLAKKLDVSPNTVARWERGELSVPPYLELALQTIERGSPDRERAPLSEYLKRTMEVGDLTARTVAKRAEQKGANLSASSIMALLKGQIENPTLRMIKALAVALDKPVRELLEAAGLQVENSSKGDVYISLLDSPRLSDLASKYEGLNSKQRQEVEPMVQQLENWIRSRLPPD